ncbi:head maturation protease, ClpP-related [Piscirickettsia litoralis]|uniref:ATP-dependent Clp protease proteolytic subunit n=1 Tax=Piscirickettsia litoralis TaxID=1891921 RepID=A0ABX2ZXG8_9GAMM|nr:head maturation protease, ClpP-related [Piscirickettsia litoralis]ODN41173.1 hypothetical protein BGC07_18030 [Piscirickettsia litoralis]
MKTNSWFSMKALSSSSAKIEIYDEIGYWGITSKEFANELNALGNEINEIKVLINSPGGSVDDGITIYSLLKAHNAHVSVEIQGMAASIASVIAMAGDSVSMNHLGLFMIHNPATVARGDADEMRKAAEVLDKVKNNIIKSYTAKTGMSEDALSELMDDVSYLDAAEAKSFGFIDNILHSEPVTNHFFNPQNKVSSNHLKRIQNMSTKKTTSTPPIENKTTTKPPVTESHTDPVAVERERVSNILNLCNQANQNHMAQSLISNGLTLEQAQNIVSANAENQSDEVHINTTTTPETPTQNKSSFGELLNKFCEEG